MKPYLALVQRTIQNSLIVIIFGAMIAIMFNFDSGFLQEITRSSNRLQHIIGIRLIWGMFRIEPPIFPVTTIEVEWTDGTRSSWKSGRSLGNPVINGHFDRNAFYHFLREGLQQARESGWPKSKDLLKFVARHSQKENIPVKTVQLYYEKYAQPAIGTSGPWTLLDRVLLDEYSPNSTGE